MNYKNLFIIITLMVISITIQGNELDQRVRQLSLKVNNEIQRNSDTLSRQELREVVRHLRSIKMIFHGGYDPRPSPKPPRRTICRMEATHIYQNTFKKIKDIAYSLSGLNMSTSNSRKFALEWTELYSCNIANQYVLNIRQIKDFAYSISGLNMNSSDSASYAQDNAIFLCSGSNLKKEFKQHYAFAYSISGLNMNSQQSRKYALEKIEYTSFSCRL